MQKSSTQIEVSWSLIFLVHYNIIEILEYQHVMWNNNGQTNATFLQKNHKQ